MPLILGANQLTAGGYEIDNSLRFNVASTDFLIRTIASTGSNQIWTASGWTKREQLGASSSLYCSSDSSAGNNFRSLFINASDQVQCAFFDGTYTFQVETNALLRDVSAWYHIVAAVDTTQATASNRVKIWINGVLQTSFATASYPTQNATINFSTSGYKQLIASLRDSSTILNGCYLAEMHILDGVAKQASDFGEFDSDTNIWKPIPYTGTYGTNGFYLEFKDSSALGDDTSGNGNDFTVNNLTSVDQSTDTPTNNFATLNSLNVPASNQPTFSEGNLKSTSSTAVSGSFGGSSSIGVSKGKWYVEAKAGAIVSSNVMNIGVTYNPSETARTNNDNKENYEYTYNGSGNKSNNSSDTAYGSSYTTGDIIGIALDLDNNKIWWSKNGTFQNSGDPVAGTGEAFTLTSGETYFFYQQDETGASANTSTFEFNFGSPPFTISSGNADANGYGNFEYAVPSGYFALCTKNLADYG
jgi:hypothetical protein